MKHIMNNNGVYISLRILASCAKQIFEVRAMKCFIQIVKTYLRPVHRCAHLYS